jgi:tagatose-1,6-bisphosphate aldolase non-catalytic subunit AgaZ/GatZ
VGQPPDVEVVVQRTVELIAYSESERERLGLPAVSYEVGTEEVHGGLVDMQNFDHFLVELQAQLGAAELAHVWPCFIVGQVGTDLHTTRFDPASARRLYSRVAPLGSLIKGHYTDWVDNPTAYPATGMGGANVGPEFTATELSALQELCDSERELMRRRSPNEHSAFMESLKAAVVDSNRWQKWLLPHERDRPFDQLAPARQDWLVATGARYVWTEPRVLTARQRLYQNLTAAYPDPNRFVVDRIADKIQTYVDAFDLRDSLPFLAE